MKITIKMLTGRTKIFEMEPSDSILKLKLLISEWLRVSYYGLKLGNPYMESHRTFKSYGINGDTMIPLILGNHALPLHND